MKKIMTVFIVTMVFLSSIALAFAEGEVQVKETKATEFTDLSGHWAKDAVQKLAEKGALPFDEEKFVPGRAITRSEFAVILHKALDIQIAYFQAPDITDYFTDVKQDAPYAMALIDLLTANILEGKGSFRPEAALSREEMVHYMMNAYKYKMGENYKEIKIGPSTFKDSNEINPLYSGDLARGAHYKLIAGYGGNLFHPKGNTTRAEAAVVINNLLNLLEKENQEVVIQPSVAAKEDSLEMKLSIFNHSGKEVTLTHSSGLKYDFKLLDADKKELYTWSADKVFILMLTSTTIQTGESLEYVEMLDKNIYQEFKDKAVYLRAFLIGESDSFTIDTEGYEIKIK